MVNLNPIDLITSKLSSNIGGTILNLLAWLFGLIILCSCVAFGYWYYLQGKKFNKKIRVWEIVGNRFEHTFVDTAKDVKLGKGAFIVLFLRKLKTWKLAYGGRSGRNVYDFFIMPDGYWYNGTMAASLFKIDDLKGLIPIQTTNPLMRAQYTALEKQIDILHGDKVGFWDKYGNWVLSGSFILIIGILAWLIFKEISPIMGQSAGLVEKLSVLIDRVEKLTANINIASGNAPGIIKAT
jgi:hypothetical protein